MSRPREKTGELLPPRGAAPARAPDSGVATSAGRPLDAAVRAPMEAAFGHDFSRVRVHADAAAAERARAAGAHAFTAGRDVVFGAGRFRPAAPEGRRLLAHELAHVVQQEGRPASDDASTAARSTPTVSAGHPSERAADAAAERVTGRGPALGSAPPLPALLRAAPPPAGAVVQRQAAPGAPPAPATHAAPAALPLLPGRDGPAGGLAVLGVPGLGMADTLRFLEQQRAPVREWLDAHTDTLRLLSGAGIVLRVRRRVPEASRMADAEILAEARAWAARHDHVLPRLSVIPEPGEPGIPGAPAGPALGDSEIVGAVRGAFSAAVDGVGVRREHGQAVVSVSGATVGLRTPGGGSEVTGTIGWGGSMGVTARHGDVHFAATLSADRWDVTLSFPGDSPAPMLAQLGEIFRGGEGALRGIVRDAGGIPLTDTARLGAAVAPHVEPLTEAVDAAAAIAATVPRRVHVGVSASGPGPAGPDAAGPGRPEGISISATVTFAF